MISKVLNFSKFYYGHTVTEENNKIDFKEGAGPALQATLTNGEYTLTEYCAEIQRALNEAGALNFTVTVNRSTRLITIAASGVFSLLFATGAAAGIDISDMAGFNAVDYTLAATYTGSSSSGSVYYPQFRLQEYVDPESWQQAADVSLTKTTSGDVEVLKYGTEKFLQFKIMFATNITGQDGSTIKDNPNGVGALQAFMQYLVTKAPVEFMPDESVPATFHKVILESNSESNTGTGYKLHELYDKGAQGYFETSIQKMRVIE